MELVGRYECTKAVTGHLKSFALEPVGVELKYCFVRLEFFNPSGAKVAKLPDSTESPLKGCGGCCVASAHMLSAKVVGQSELSNRDMQKQSTFFFFFTGLVNKVNAVWTKVNSMAFS